MRQPAGGSPGERLSPADRVREKALVDSIRQLLTPADRAFFDEVLEKGGNWGSPAFNNPEVRSRLTELMRLYGVLPTAPLTPGQIEAKRKAVRDIVEVAIALVPPSALGGERIVLVRRAADAYPLVLLNEVDGTDVEARAGVKAAVAALNATPRAPAAETRTAVRLADFDASKLVRGEIISELRTNVPFHNLAGFGSLKWTVVAAPRQ